MATLVPQDTVQDPLADKMIEDTLAPKSVPLPSTPENQLSTQAAQSTNAVEQESLDRAATALKYNGDKPATDIDIQRKAISQMRADEQKQQADEKAQIAKDRSQATLELAKLTDDTNNLQADIDYARSKGLDTSALEAEFTTKSARHAQLLDVVKPTLAATPDDVQQAQQPTVADVEREAQPIRAQAARGIAQQQEIVRQQVKQQQKVEEAQKQVETENKKLDAIDPQRFWNNKSTGEKILAALAVFMGGAGKGENQALTYIQNQIRQDIEAQKLTLDEAKAKEEHALKLAQLQLQKVSTGISNELKRAQIQKLYGDIQTERESLNQQRVLNKRLSSGEGLSREEVFSLPEKARNTFVVLPDGKAYQTLSKEDAAIHRKETIPNTQNAIQMIGRLKEINNQVASGSLDITGARKEAQSLQQQLVGVLRLDLFGPGVLSDTEQERAKAIIADPTVILSLKGSNATLLNALESKLRYSMKNKLRASGVNIPPSRNEANLAKLKQVNPSAPSATLIDALKRTKTADGRPAWDDNEQ